MHIEESTRVDRFISPRKLSSATPEKVLEELFNLLEEYGPTWYTEEHHNRVVAALCDRNW
jgi:hypothetical protein